MQIVFTYVDNSDQHWQSKLKRYAPKKSPDDGRWRGTKFIEYAIRSVIKYAKFVDEIILFTDSQRLKNCDCTYVYHQDVIPAEYLPTFHSDAIESCIHRIPRLKERFLYSADDFYFGQPVTVRDFFTDDDKVITRMTNHAKDWKPDSDYGRKVKFGCDKIGIGYFYNTHTTTGYKLSLLGKMWREFPDLWEGNMKDRFRGTKTFERTAWGAWMRARGYAINWLDFNKKSDNYFNSFDRQEYKTAKLFCMNDNGGTEEDIQRAYEWLEGTLK
jgi:hypothetical protein